MPLKLPQELSVETSQNDSHLSPIHTVISESCYSKDEPHPHFLTRSEMSGFGLNS